MLRATQQWQLTMGVVMAVIMIEVVWAISYHHHPLAAQQNALRNPSEHPPPAQEIVPLNLALFSLLAELFHRDRQCHLVGDQEPPTPLIPRGPCFLSLTVLVLSLCLVLTLQHYKRRIVQRARGMARRYITKKLKGMLYRSLKTVLTEFSKELLRIAALELGKAAAVELANILINEIRL